MGTIYLKVVHDRKGKGKGKGNRKETPVEIRLTQNRQTMYYNTGIRLQSRHWHNGQVTHRIDSRELQYAIDQCVRFVRRTINEMEEKGPCRLSELMSTLRAREVEQASFIEFCGERASVRSHGKSADTRERYERFMRWLRGYGRIVAFADVTDKAVMEMDKHLADTGMKNYSKWNNYHRFLNSFILDAIDEGLLARNPYKHILIEKDKSSGGLGKYLTAAEFRRIAKMKLPTESLQRVRDLFVFQTYTCLSFADLKTFDAAKIRYVKGKPVYTAKRGKTKQEFTFLLLPPAMAILRKYGNSLPVISNVKYNQYLKSVALMAKIDKPISSHWARHTGATMLLNEGGLDMEIVAKVLGHSSTKITRQVYAKLLDETVVDAMSKMKC